MKSVKELMTLLNYDFLNIELLKQALTIASSHKLIIQRLEFVGDSVFNVCITTLLYRQKPDWREGQLAKLRAYIISTESLYQWANDIKLFDYLIIEDSIINNCEYWNKKKYADIMEAVLGAIFLDALDLKTGMDSMMRVIQNRYSESINLAEVNDWKQRDYKTALQEKASSLGLPHPAYEMLDKAGPDHKPSFTVEVSVGPYTCVATSTTRKSAETLAAQKIIQSLPRE